MSSTPTHVVHNMRDRQKPAPAQKTANDRFREFAEELARKRYGTDQEAWR